MGLKRNVEKENPPAVSIPIGNTPILSPIPEESAVQTGNPGIPMTISEEQDISKRWNQLRQAGTSTNVQRTNPMTGNKQKGPERDQSTIPNFFEFDGSKEIPQFVTPDEWLNAVQGSVPLPTLSAPMETGPVRKDSFPRRITPIPVNPKREVQVKSKGTVHAEQKSGNAGNTSGEDGETIDLRTETTATSRNTPRPTFGSTTMDTTEEQRIHTIVCRVMEEKYGQGRAALRQHLGLAPEDPKMSKESVAPSVPVGTEVPRTSFGSPLSIDGVSPSVPSVSTGSQPFATAAWKPKEPPCFFGRSTEDAHTWVSLVRNYLTFMSGSDSQQVAYTVTLFRDAAHEWYMSYERRNRGPPRDWAGLVAALLDRFGSNIRSQEAQSQLMSISQGNRAVRDYASQFETLLGRLDSYDEGLMLNQLYGDCSPIWLDP